MSPETARTGARATSARALFALGATMWLGALAGAAEALTLRRELPAGLARMPLFTSALAFGLIAGLFAAPAAALAWFGVRDLLGAETGWRARLRQVAALAVGLWLGLTLANTLGLWLLLGGFHNKPLAALTFALLLLPAWLLGRGARSLAHDALDALGRRSSRAGVAAALLVLGAVGAGTGVAAGSVLLPIAPLLPWAAAAMLPVLIGVAWLVGRVASRVGLRTAVVATASACVVLGVALPRAMRQLEYAPTTRTLLATRGRLLAVIPSFLASGVDSDRDGYSSAFGGGDCDDADATVSPAALEVLGNGVDENCDGIAQTRDVTVEALSGHLPGPGCQSDLTLPPKTNVWLVVVNAMRADRLEGYERVTAPNLRRLSHDGVNFTHCYSPHPQTAFAIPTLFTGMTTRWARDLMKSQYANVPPQRKMIQEVLHARGYRSAATYGHQLAGHRHKLTRGFDLVKELPMEPSGQKIADQATEWLEQLATGSQPWFLYTHFYDPHWSYSVHPPELAPWGTAQRVDRYDSEIFEVDHHIARIEEAMKRLHVWEKTLLLVVSDHGEEFGEHDGEFHGHTMYDEVIRIPCFVRGPGIQKASVTQPVLLFDFYPTLLDLLGVPWPTPIQAASLEPLMLGRDCQRGPLVEEMQPWTRRPPVKPWLWMLLSGKHKLLYDVKANGYQLFDLAADPGERQNLVEVEPDVLAELRPLLQRLVAERLALPSNSSLAKALDFGPLPPGTEM